MFVHARPNWPSVVISFVLSTSLAAAGLIVLAAVFLLTSTLKARAENWLGWALNLG